MTKQKSALMRICEKYKRLRFLFEELVKRDFKHKYKQTVLGMGWSLLNPILQLLVMRIVFTQFFGRNKPFYSTYLFAGIVVFSFFTDSTNGGMGALVNNAQIINKINVPKYLFLLSRNVSAIINFLMTLVVFFAFAMIDGVTPSFRFVLLVYPVACLIILNIGMGLILSAMYVYFRDMQYLYQIFTLLLRYMSAVFYYVDGYPAKIQKIFMINPIYDVIRYIRLVVIDGVIPSWRMHAILLGYALLAIAIGGYWYKKKNHEFLYYL